MRDILDAAASCAVLITSRHHLALTLDVVIDLEALSRKDAVDLFRSRCQPHQLDETAMPVAADICATLGDLPLAIDLAAKLVATGRVARLDKLLGRLKKAALQVLQLEDQSVRASFNVSYDALKPESQQLFASLGLFAGDSFSIEAVEAASGQQDVENRLGDLIAFSLVKRVYVETSDERFGLHPLLKEFASEKLDIRTDVQAILRRVAEYFLHYAQQHTDNYDSLELERENVLRAMDWCYENEEWSMVLAYEDALVQDGLRGFLSVRGYWDEQELRLNQALEASHKLSDRESEAESIHTLGMTFMHRGNWNRAQEYYQRGLEIWELLDHQRGIAATLHEMGRIVGRRGQYDKAREYFQHSLRIKEQVGDQRDLAATLECLGGIASEQGHYEEAQLYYHRALDMVKQEGDQLQTTVILADMGGLARLQGRYEEALNLYERSLSIAQELGSKEWIAVNLHEMGLIRAIQGHCEEAQCYYQQSLEITQELGDQPSIAATLYCPLC